MRPQYEKQQPVSGLVLTWKSLLAGQSCLHVSCTFVLYPFPFRSTVPSEVGSSNRITVSTYQRHATIFMTI